MNRAGASATPKSAVATRQVRYSSSARATAGGSKGIIGSFQLSDSSRLGSLSSACARRFACSATAASARVFPGSSSSAVSAASILHGACLTSWSDTFRYMVPRAQGVPKVGFPVRPKICVLFQR